MIDPPPDLPVAEALPALKAALGAQGRAVLVAPPGAGKTTLVPLALAGEPWASSGRIVLLEPRRLAARAAAHRMAALLGEEPGARVGYATRMESRQSARTRILVVTEGIFTRMAVDDPELKGIAAIIFDEFHERSLDGDFGLALALDIAGGFRPDLRLLVMSATIDGARVATRLGDAPLVRSEGRTYPVAMRYRDRAHGVAVEDAVAAACREALSGEPGSVLAFLPGQREIEKTAERLEGRLPADVELHRLYGAVDIEAQDRAIRPPAPGVRKLVLASAIAETSITIDGVRTVVDSGLSRVPRYEPDTGVTRLETVRVSRAAADQRAGRAGRTAPGIAVRLWSEPQTAALQPFDTPEIHHADLSGLVLDCAAFGVSDPRSLPFPDPPPEPALAEARALLVDLGALDRDGRLTASGRAMRGLALPARLAHMVAEADRRGDGPAAATLAMVIVERGLGGTSPDLDRRVEGFRRDRSVRADRARALARRMTGAGQVQVPAGRLLLDAFPDRVAMARGETGRFLLANGRGASIDAADALAAESFLVVADLQGKAQSSRIVAAAAVSEADIRSALAGRIATRTTARFDAARGALRRFSIESLGAIPLVERTLPPPTGAEADEAIVAAVRETGLSLLPFDRDTTALRRRLSWLHARFGPPWPAMDDAALLSRLDAWLLPFLSGETRPDRIAPAALRAAVQSLVPHDLARQLDRLAPTHFAAPTGNRLPILYEENGPVLAVRVQELFGLDRHPAIGDGDVPLTLELLSPAHRPIQTTRDLPGFWRGSWADVRAEMRGRYPRHEWPEDPRTSRPTARAKPRPR